MYYLYRFLDKNGNVIYVGKTQGKLNDRLKCHNHIMILCYLSVSKIEFCELNTDVDLTIYEIYYINKYRPIYNKADKGIKKMTIQLPELEWKEYVRDDGADYFGGRITILRENNYNIKKLYNKMKSILMEAISKQQRAFVVNFVLPQCFKYLLRQELPDGYYFDNFKIGWVSGETLIEIDYPKEIREKMGKNPNYAKIHTYEIKE